MNTRLQSTEWASWTPEIISSESYLHIYSTEEFKRGVLELVKLGMKVADAVRFVVRDEDLPKKFHLNAQAYICNIKRKQNCQVVADDVFIRSTLAYQIYSIYLNESSSCEAAVNKTCGMFNRSKATMRNLIKANEVGLGCNVTPIRGGKKVESRSKYHTKWKTQKHVRFPHEMIDEIEEIRGGVDFSTWVRTACEERLDVEKRNEMFQIGAETLTDEQRGFMIYEISAMLRDKPDWYIQRAFSTMKSQ